MVSMMVGRDPVGDLFGGVPVIPAPASRGITDPGPAIPPAGPDNTGDGHADDGLADDASTAAEMTTAEILEPGELPAVDARPTCVTDTIVVNTFIPEIRPATANAVTVSTVTATASWAADQVVTDLYLTEYKSLVRLAMLLVHDVPTAEEVVQDSFEAMHRGWQRLRDSQKALSYLRQAVVNRSRSVLRHRTVVDRNAPKPAPDEPSAESGALASIERGEVVAALRRLPERQREALVLRYYGDFSEAEIATAMGISRGAVKSHTARGMSALKLILEQETS